MKQQSDFQSFQDLDIRVGTVLEAVVARTNKPTYRMTIDFGSEIGKKISCGAYTNYSVEDVVGKQVLAIVNFAPRKMGPELSEVLVLGIHAMSGDGTIFLTPDLCVQNGESVF